MDKGKGVMAKRIDILLVKHGYIPITSKVDTHDTILLKFLNAVMDELNIMKQEKVETKTVPSFMCDNPQCDKKSSLEELMIKHGENYFCSIDCSNFYTSNKLQAKRNLI